MKNFVFIVLLLGSTAMAHADWIDGQMPLKAEDAIKPAALPFPLENVRLTGGSFLQVQELERAYLRSLEPDRFLVKFRSEAGLEAKPNVKVYGGWEGTTPLAGHSFGHFLSAASKMYAATGDEILKAKVEESVAGLAEVQAVYDRDPRWAGYLSAISKGKELFEATAAGDVELMGKTWVVPFYTQHKILAGLLDAYRYTGNSEALTLAARHADWMIRFFDPLTGEQFERMLRTEFGGVAMPLAELYSITGERKYLDFALRFEQKSIVEPWKVEQSNLPGLHANTQIPKAAVCAKIYELTGDASEKTAAEFFWNTVVFHHSYVTGGNSNREHFGPADQLDNRFDAPTETCNTYNMLKLTEHLYRWNPENPAYFDYFERALLNHILGAFNHQTNPETHFENGLTCYFIHFGPGGFRYYESPYDAFTCCFGTGMENPGQYGQSIYWRSPDNKTLYVNLFLPSRLDWQELGVRVETETDYPASGRVSFRLTASREAAFDLKVRIPFWTGKTGYQTFPVRLQKGESQTVTVDFPMSLRVESMPDNPSRVAIFYGPTLLTADLGPISEDPNVPALISGSRSPSDWLSPVENEPLHFASRPGAFTAENLRFLPFFALHERRNDIFFDVFTPEQWESRQAEIAEKQRKERELAARRVDSVMPGEMQSERDHRVASAQSDTGSFRGRKFRHAADGGWFSYEISVVPGTPLELACDFWGSDDGNREFTVLIDDTPIADIALRRNQPDEFYTQIIPLPPELVGEKTSVTLKFQARPGNFAGGVFGIHVYRAEKQTSEDENPLIWADVPDVSVIRVGDTYYMSSTTMHLSPGLPIMKSRDLLNWEIAGYAYDTLEPNAELDLRDGRNAYGSGSWASSLRFHDEWFIVSTFCFNTKKTHIFRTRNVETGPWEHLAFRPSVGDHSLFFEDDGRVFVVNGSGTLRLEELEPDLSGLKRDGIHRVIIPDASLVAGENVGLPAEGTQLFKVDGKYYIFCITWPRGGMRTELVFRSDKLEGPYEGRVAFACDGIAQGGIFDTPDGRWFAMLFGDRGGVGRIPYLVPVTWEDGWPVLGTAGRELPALNLPGEKDKIPACVASDEFSREPGSPALPLVWQWNHTPDNALWSLTERPGWLRLKTGNPVPDFLSAKNTLTQRTFGPTSRAEISLDVRAMRPGDLAGLALLQKFYSYVAVEKHADHADIVVLGNEDRNLVEMARVPFSGEVVWFRAECDFENQKDTAQFSYSTDGERWTPVGRPCRMPYTLPHFMGYRFAIFNFATETPGGHVDVNYYRIGL